MPAAWEPVVGAVARDGRLAARLSLPSPTVEQGGVITYSLSNVGTMKAAWGHGEIVQRRAGGRWRPARGFHRNFTAWPEVLLHLDPGHTEGPDTFAETNPNRILLAARVRPGRYRIVKPVDSAASLGRDARGTLVPARRVRPTVAFRVVRGGGPPVKARDLWIEGGPRRNGPVSASLAVEPEAAEPEESLEVTVTNLGPVPLRFGPGGAVLRWTNSRSNPLTLGWSDASGRFGMTLEQRYDLGEGELLEPSEGGAPTSATEALAIPAGAPPGLYVLHKLVAGAARDPAERNGLRVGAAFRVIAPG